MGYSAVSFIAAWATNIAATSIPCRHSVNSLIFHLFYDILNKEFKRHMDNIAWDSEVWIAEAPDHMIHFNGPKFLLVHNGTKL